jgi:hypothetical protein
MFFESPDKAVETQPENRFPWSITKTPPLSDKRILLILMYIRVYIHTTTPKIPTPLRAARESISLRNEVRNFSGKR